MPSSDVKYIGLDVHKEAIAIAVLNGAGKVVMESIVETKASTLLDFLHGLRGELHVTLEEGTWAAWLYDVLKPHVREIVVCNPRRNALLKEGSKSDKVDARKLAELLRTGMLRAVYHGENGLRTLRELARSYEVVINDSRRVMNRVKALYRGWGIPCTGMQVYSRRYREPWLNKILEPGVRRRAELFYQQLDGLQTLRQLAIWSYQLANGDTDAATFNMVNAMLFRIHQSGHLAELSPESFMQVKNGLRVYKEKIRPHIRSAVPYYPLGMPDLMDTISPVSLGMRSPKSNFVAVWRLQGDERIHLPKIDPEMNILYPTDLDIRIDRDGDGISAVFPRKMMACILSSNW